MHRRFAPLAVFALCALLLYGRTLSHGFVRFDDDYLVSANPAVQSITPGTLKTVFTTYDPELYIPLTFVSYQVDDLLGGGSPLPFHLTNILLHALNAFLVFALIGLLGFSRRTAWIAGLLFLAHPLQVEAVAWVSARKDLLSSFFFLLSTCLLVRFWRTGRASSYAGSVASLFFGLLAKVTVALQPAIVLLLAWRERRSLKHESVRVIPYAILAVVFIVIGAYGKRDVIAQSTSLEWFLLIVKSLGFYLRAFVAPYGLSVVYPHVGFDVPSMVASGIAVALLLGLVVWSLRFTRDGVVAAGWFLMLLAPSFLNYFKGGDTYFASDRYVYLPSVALFAVAAVFAERLIARSKLFAIAGIALLAVYASAAFVRAGDWRDTETLFTDAIAIYPESQLAQTKVAAFLIDKGDLDRAERMLNDSLAIRPTARAYYNLGLIALQRGRNEEALELNLQAIALDPNHDGARVNAGYLLAVQERYAEAIVQYEGAVRANPFDLDAKVSLASLLLNTGDAYRAKELLAEVLAVDPQHSDAQKLLAP